MAQPTYKSNREIALICEEIGYFLEMEEVAFKPKAYEKAGEIISEMSEDIFDVYMRGGIKALENLPGIGVSIAEKIEEFLKTGKVKYLEELKKKWPIKIEDFLPIEGIGPKTIRHLYENLGIKDMESLEKALKANKVSGLEGFGEKRQEKILKNIEFYRKSGGRQVLGFILPEIRMIEEKLKKARGVDRVDIAGSIRRRKETIGDIDILVISKNPGPVMDFFTNMPEVERVVARGETKSAVRLKNGLDADLRVVPPESYGAALNYFTGSKDHNIALREIAIKKGYKLNEYGLFKREKQITGKTEEDLYKKLGLKYIEPELREMKGEIEAAQKNKLPKLIEYKSLAGNLHSHTNWSDGMESIEDTARAAMQRGLKYLVISDHTKHLSVANGLDEKRLKEQWEEIDKVNNKFKKESLDFKILKGTECDILKDGSLDWPDEILAQLDVVNASVHSSFGLSEEEQTARVKKAMSNKNVDIICHPTGRLLNQREAYKIDMDEIIKFAKQTGTVLEVNAFPNRLDLNDDNVRKCIKMGVKIAISCDSHLFNHFDYLEYGIGQARRGWAEKKDVINAWPLEKMLKMLK